MRIYCITLIKNIHKNKLLTLLHIIIHLVHDLNERYNKFYQYEKRNEFKGSQPQQKDTHLTYTFLTRHRPVPLFNFFFNFSRISC